MFFCTSSGCRLRSCCPAWSFNTWCDSRGLTDTRMVVEGRFWLLEGCVFLLGSAVKITAVGLGMIVGSIWEPADHCWPDQSILVCYYTMYNGQTSPSVRRSWITTCLRCNHRLSDQFLLFRASIVNSRTYNICLFCVLFVSCCLFHAGFGPESEQNVKD